MGEVPKVDVNEELTRRVADLARLRLSDEEVKTFTAQLADILQYMDQLGELETEGVDPMTHPLEMETPLREDEARPSPAHADGRSRMLDAAPEVIDDGFKVPPIL